MADKHTIVAIYMTPNQADEAFSRLQAEGSDLGLLSFMGRDYWKDMVGSRSVGERFLYRGRLAPFWERLWATLSHWGIFCFFENGPVLVAGPLVRTMIATQEEGRSGLLTGGFAEALTGIGIPPESLVQYERALMNNQILVFIQGSLHEIDRAQDILDQTKSINHTIHHNS